MGGISARILSYNRPEFLTSALHSVLNQTWKADEIIIYDNGSDGLVYESVRSHLHAGVRFVGSDKTHSAIWNFQRAMHAPGFDFLFVLHDDDVLCPDFIERQVGFLESHPHVGAVTCNGFLINYLGKRTGGLVRPDYEDGSTEFYGTAASVAILYASDSCFPFSPIVYRANVLKPHMLRPQYGKVIDAVLCCEFAKVSSLAYRAIPLYECRVHSGQDSDSIPESLLDQLVQYFEYHAHGSPGEIRRLHYLLRRQYLVHLLIKVRSATIPHIHLGKLFSLLHNTNHYKLSLLALVDIVAVALWKRLR